MEHAQQDAATHEMEYEPPQLVAAGEFAEVTLGSGSMVIEGWTLYGLV